VSGPRPRRTWLRTLAQVLGFALGLSVLGYCVWAVVSNPSHVQQVRRLADAPWWVVAGLLALSSTTLLTTAMVFRATLRPVHKAPVADMAAINALCTLLGNAPFKLSLVARTLIHHRRHRVPLPTLVSVLAGTAGVILISLGPALGATLLLRRVDTLWWALTIGGTLVLALVCVRVARVLAPIEAWHALARRMPGALARVMHSAPALKLHHGLRTLADARAVAEALAWRAADLAVATARFKLAAFALGAALPWDQALIAASTYFILQGAAPTGALGAREGGTAAVLGALIGAQALPLIVTVTAVESAANLVWGVAGAAYLRVDRLLRGAPATPAPTAATDATHST
jgi:hypothetical protein